MLSPAMATVSEHMCSPCLGLLRNFVVIMAISNLVKVERIFSFGSVSMISDMVTKWILNMIPVRIAVRATIGARLFQSLWCVRRNARVLLYAEVTCAMCYTGVGTWRLLDYGRERMCSCSYVTRNRRTLN